MFLHRNSATSARANIIVSHLNHTGITKLGKVSLVHRTVSAWMLLKHFSWRNPRLAAMGWSPLYRGCSLGQWPTRFSFLLCENTKKKKKSCHYRKPKTFFAVYLWRLWLPGWHSAHAHRCQEFKLPGMISNVSRNTIFTLLCFCMMMTNAIPHQGSTHQKCIF